LLRWKMAPFLHVRRAILWRNRMAPHSPDSLAGLKVWCPGKGRKRRRD